MTLRRNSSSGQENKPFLGVCSRGRRAGGGKKEGSAGVALPAAGGRGEASRTGYEEAAAAGGSGRPAPASLRPGSRAVPSRAGGGASRPLAAAAGGRLGKGGEAPGLRRRAGAGLPPAAAGRAGQLPAGRWGRHRAAPGWGGLRGGAAGTAPPVGAESPHPADNPSRTRRARAGTCFQGGISSSRRPLLRPRLAFIGRELEAPALHQLHGDEQAAPGTLGSPPGRARRCSGACSALSPLPAGSFQLLNQNYTPSFFTAEEPELHIPNPLIPSTFASPACVSRGSVPTDSYRGT